MKRVSLDEITGLSRQRRYQLRRIEAGLCQTCGRPRTAKGSDTRCAKHARLNRAHHHQKAKAA